MELEIGAQIRPVSPPGGGNFRLFLAQSFFCGISKTPEIKVFTVVKRDACIPLPHPLHERQPMSRLPLARRQPVP